MNSVLRNVLAVIAGWIVGSIVNMGLITLGYSVTPIPNVDPNDMAAMAEVMPTLAPKFFIFPFLGHALGTLVGALVAGAISKTRKMLSALIVGVLFFIGGIVVNIMLQGPAWFTIVDILLAYIPMAYIGGRLARRITRN
ncbi:hypothetical protein GCM10011344_04160 [Dokdonia pacifica]|uniref:Uncharacterized protein n=1 Tax=Dokdonia pacifica TaxID=1627892 RepID=A0A238ZIV3_9FLAO|nr:hypothetical protein [Dokdonia pacifica]GGG06836.1 hypothetical protein GCM10011344_04160 [Dokdonia pacifica]SNR83355.1 hypothetical protein SAMN06265376_103277 [Dokdonia pacifica]